jgi:hypothetical protein
VRVDWVHPSWRDLVIAALAADPAERRRFLERCGVDGAAVAISLDGRPLLAEDADWDALADGLHRLCAELEDEDAVRLLTVLAETERDPEVTALAALVARRLARRWRGRAVPVDALAAWAAVAAWLPDPPEPPPATATWLGLVPTHAPATPVELERFADWLRLAELLDRRDPSLLEALGFPESHRGLLEDFAVSIPRVEPPAEHDLRMQSLERLGSLLPSCPAGSSLAALRVDELELLPVPPADELPSPARFPVERVLRDLVD